MSSGDRWQVVVLNDDHSTFSVVHHVLRAVCGHDAATARALTLQIHHGGEAQAGTYDLAEAETVAVRLIRSGLRTRLVRQR